MALTDLRLSIQAIHSTPITVESWSALHEHEEDSSGYWETAELEHDEHGTYDLITDAGSVVGIQWDGETYEDRESFVEAYEAQGVDVDERYTRRGTAEEVWDWATEEAEAYQYAEGPMMNYWYPIEEKADGSFMSYGRTFDPVAAAGKLAHSNLCVVLVNGEYGLALTGAGMDFSWEICDAFIRLGMAPPMHFTDLPAMAMTWGAREERVYEGCAYTLAKVEELAQRGRLRLEDLRSRMSGGK